MNISKQRKLKKMKFKENVEPLVTSEFFYDLFDGGYIEPSDLLVAEDAKRVNEAVRLILEFRDRLEEEGIMEYC
jgi:hypothetical protein